MFRRHYELSRRHCKGILKDIARSSDFYNKVFGRNIQKRKDASIAFDGTTAKSGSERAKMHTTIDRRGFLTGIASVGTASFAVSRGSRRAASPVRKSTDSLPARDEFLIRDAYLLTMDPALGDIPGGSVHVKNGAIMAVGKGIKAPGATIIEGRGAIVLPGLVDTH